MALEAEWYSRAFIRRREEKGVSDRARPPTRGGDSFPETKRAPFPAPSLPFTRWEMKMGYLYTAWLCGKIIPG